MKAGKTGPALQPHPEDYPCPAVPDPSQNQVAARRFPALCGGLFPLPPGTPGRQHIGARRVTIELIANSLSAMGQPERPVIDRTGLGGNFDFALEWVPEPVGAQSANPDLQPDPSGPTFLEALKDQLGSKLEPQRARRMSLSSIMWNIPPKIEREQSRAGMSPFVMGNCHACAVAPAAKSGPKLHKAEPGGNSRMKGRNDAFLFDGASTPQLAVILSTLPQMEYLVLDGNGEK